MGQVYSTSDIAGIFGIHPNTVRLYEELKLIPAPERGDNGYRIFTQLHIDHFILARKAFEVEILQNGLRKQMVEIIKISAAGDYDLALKLNNDYLKQIDLEIKNAEEAVNITALILEGESEEEETLCLTRKEVADYLHVTIDTLRNWELNGLLTVKRRKNGYRIYESDDIKRLKIIRSLRCANYSLASILRMLSVLSDNPQADIRAAINLPQHEEDIISACDQLLTSLSHAGGNARAIQEILTYMKEQYGMNS